MSEHQSPNELLFEVLTPLGFRVRVSRAYWELITMVKHPAMAGRERDVKNALGNPAQARQSKSDPAVFLFYGSVQPERWVCAVAKALDGDGFLVTAYLTDAIKEGDLVWPK